MMTSYHIISYILSHEPNLIFLHPGEPYKQKLKFTYLYRCLCLLDSFLRRFAERKKNIWEDFMERGSLQEFLNATTRHGFNSCGWYECGTLTGRGCLLTEVGFCDDRNNTHVKPQRAHDGGRQSVGTVCRRDRHIMLETRHSSRTKSVTVSIKAPSTDTHG